MKKVDFSKALEQILERDGRYDADAYSFLRDALDHTMRKVRHPKPGDLCHVSGAELLDGLREFALEQFGPLARLVLQHWGIRRCEDVGEIVFNLVEAGVLGSTPQDKREDFAGGYDFREAFDLPFVPPSQQQRVRERWRQEGSASQPTSRTA